MQNLTNCIGLYIISQKKVMEMENKLLYIRQKSKTTKKFLAYFLNISVYTYTGYENNRLAIPPEVLTMLSIIFDIPKHTLFDKVESNSEVNKKIEYLSKLTEQEKEKLFILRLTGKTQEKISYHQISTIKKQLRENLNSQE